MDTAYTAKGDVLCTGLIVSDVLLYPVEPEVFSVDSWPVEDPRFMTGGDALNQAMILHRLGTHVRLVGCVGRDPFGEGVLRQLVAAGLDVALVEQTDAAPTSTSFVLRRGNGERHFLSVRGAADVYRFSRYDILRNFRVLSIGSLWGQKRMDLEGNLPLLKAAKAGETSATGNR